VGNILICAVISAAVRIAEKINGKQKNISGYETGATLPSIRTLAKIAKALGVSIDDIKRS